MRLAVVLVTIAVLPAIRGEPLAEPPATKDVERLRLIIETDAGGDPDDEQSLVRFLLYTNEWDVEGIIANRAKARDGENHNPERTGLGIVRRLVKAYGECHANLLLHDARYPAMQQLLQITVPGYEDTDAGVDLLIAAIDKPDPRPIWFLNWGTDSGGATSCLRRALDRVLRERGATGYASFKKKLRVSCHGNIAGEHTTTREPPFPLLVDTFRPELDKRRWYHRFSALTATAGGFDLNRDVLTGHGSLGAQYPTNTTHPQKEGDTMTFLYLQPTGMNDPEQPTWGSWAGRYGLNPEFKNLPYYWANQADTWQGTTHRDNTLKRWAADLQNDFRARLDWCVKPYKEANHAPVAVVNGDRGRRIIPLDAAPGATIKFNADGSSDPDGHELAFEWFIYSEPGTYQGMARLEPSTGSHAMLRVPADAAGKSIHVMLIARDRGTPPLASYRRVIVRVSSP
jgi:cellulose-binding protein